MKNSKQDPRFKNEMPPASNISDYAKEYGRLVAKALDGVPAKNLESAFSLIKKALADKARIYVAGNGGSAAISDHLCCDWMKGTHVAGKPALRVHSLVANSAVLTALANDFSYEESFSTQVEMLAEKGDLVVLISSSGNSANVIRAAEMALKKNIPVIGLTGFSGGKLKELSTVSLHIEANNYGIVEDCHQMLMHILTQTLGKHRDAEDRG